MIRNEDDLDRYIRAEQIIRTGQGCYSWRRDVADTQVSRFASAVLVAAIILVGLVVLTAIAAALVR